MSVTLDAVMAALRTVKDPEKGRDILSMNLVHDLKIDGDTVRLRVSVKTPVRHVRESLETQVRDALVSKAGASKVDLQMDVEGARVSADRHGIPGIKHIIAVSSGKGGVGKSTVAANLSIALAKQGAKVGLLDSDVYGPNIPTMMGVNQPPMARQDENGRELIIPLEAHGVKIMSMGFLAKGDQPLVWRGPMLHGVVSQFLLNVDWGNLDYLIVDMPPGTGDVQLSLTQTAPVSGAVVVTTPQEVSLQDVRKAILMFEKVGVPVLGIVENMSYFVCDGCDKRHHIFGSGGGKALADKYQTRLLAELPLAEAVREAGDTGAPIVVRAPDSVQAIAFNKLAGTVVRALAEASVRSGTESGAPVVNIGKF
ncbi:MAG: iron-sulfur cluster carrier protein ApbC [Deltaproteobacteria bacterium]|nr:iron-sulfur cluster carrier protein ApbC [Deltaproteobacteria bacterium]